MRDIRRSIGDLKHNISRLEHFVEKYQAAGKLDYEDLDYGVTKISYYAREVMLKANLLSRLAEIRKNDQMGNNNE